MRACSLGLERAKRSDFEHAQQCAVGDDRPRHGLERRGLAEAGRNLEVARRKIRQRDRLALTRALTDQPLTRTQRLGRGPIFREPVTGDAPEVFGVGSGKIEAGDATAEHRHEAGNKALPEFGERRGALQLAGDFGGVGFDPALLVHRRGPLLEDVDRMRKSARFISRFRERNLLGIVAGSDGFDRALERPDRMHDAAEREETEHAREAQGAAHRDQQIPPRTLDGGQRRLSRIGGDLLIILDPLSGSLAGLVGGLRHRTEQLSNRLFFAAKCRQRHCLIGPRQPFPAQRAEVVEHSPALVARAPFVRIIIHEPEKLDAVFIVVFSCGGLRGRVGGEEKTAHIHPQLGKGSRNVTQLRQRHDAGFRHEPGAFFDPGHLLAGHDPDADEDQQRDREQNH